MKMKKVLSFIFILLVASASICGVAHAWVPPTGKNKAVCDYLYRGMVDAISALGEDWQHETREYVNDIAREVCDRAGVNYLVWKIGFSDSRFDRTVLILNPLTTHAENEVDNSHICDLWGAFDSYWKLFSKGAIKEELYNGSYPLLFFDFKKYKDMIESDSKMLGITVIESTAFDKTGRRRFQAKWTA